jgi:hypothetical protein
VRRQEQQRRDEAAAAAAATAATAAMAEDRRLQELQRVMNVGNAAAGVGLVGTLIAAMLADPAFRIMYDAAVEALTQGFRLNLRQAQGVLLFVLYLGLVLGIRDVVQSRRRYFQGLQGGSSAADTNLDAVLQVPQVQDLVEAFAAANHGQLVGGV